MTITVKSCKNDSFYISLEVQHRYENDIYVVQACPCINDYECGYPEREMTYSINDKDKAYTTYRRYVKRYQ